MQTPTHRSGPVPRRHILGGALGLASAGVLGSIQLAGCDRPLYADVVIVGTGPAGIGIANALHGSGKSVLLLESGGWQPDAAIQALSEVEPGQHGLPYNISHASQRLLGGTTNLWQSHSPRPLPDELVPVSGRDFTRGASCDWPIRYPALLPWLKQAEAWLGIRPASGPTPANPVPNYFIESSQALIEATRNAGFTPVNAASFGMQQGTGIDPMRLLAQGEIKRTAGQPHVTLMPHTHVRKLVMAKNRVAALACVDADGQPLQVEGQTIILCAGGIQTARILWNSLAANGQPGLGNHSDWLGAGFMEHPGSQIYGRANHAFLQAGHHSARADVHSASLPAQQAGTLMQVGVKRGRDGAEYMMVQALHEQAPWQHNRVWPGLGTDRYGDPLVKIDWHLNVHDKAAIKAGEAAQMALAQALMTEIQGRSPVRNGSHHLMGATRMSAEAATGVVDANLKVWHTDNLYICGASVLPTGLTVPPTAIVAALALRLGAHLRAAERS